MQVESSFVGASERQQTLHQVGHSADFLQRFLQSDHTLGLTRRLRHGALDVSAQHCQWRFQFMAGIGGESSQSGERRLQPRDHGIESGHQISEVSRLLAQRQPAMQAAPVGDCGDFGGDLG